MISQWEIYEFPWEHKDEGGKRKDRPVLVVSTTEYNQSNESAWIMKISSVRHDRFPLFELKPSDPAHTGTGLGKKKTSHFYILDVRKVLQSEFKQKRGKLGVFAAFAIAELMNKYGTTPK